MGFRFRKSIKIAPGVKLNLNKKSVGLSVGGKAGGFSVNSNGRKTSRVSIPGTGISYTHTSGKKKKGKAETKASTKQKKTSKPVSVSSVLTVLFVLLGIYWIASGNTGLGVICLIVLCLFGIRRKSSAKAKKAYLLEWQNAMISDQSGKLFFDKDQLLTMTVERFENDMRIVDDCTNLIETTTKPDVFFSRMDLLEETAGEMVQYEKFLSFEDALPSDALKEVCEKKQLAIHEFLTRYLDQIYTEVDGLKTEAAKNRRYENFYNSLVPYFDQMDESNVDFVKTKYDSFYR